MPTNIDARCCDDVAEMLGEQHHCWSCHDDYYEGYPMLWLDEGDGLPREVEVCCAVFRAWEEAQKDGSINRTE